MYTDFPYFAAFQSSNVRSNPLSSVSADVFISAFIVYKGIFQTPAWRTIYGCQNNGEVYSRDAERKGHDAGQSCSGIACNKSGHQQVGTRSFP